MIETLELTKVYSLKGKEVVALSSVTFSTKGGITAIVGHNGAGKTTLIKVLSTLVIPTSGDAFVEGYSVTRDEKKVRELIGLVSVSERQFYYRLSAMDNLLFFSSLQGLSLGEARSRARELLEILGLREWENVPYMKFSTGMQRKLALARALITDPPVLLLDEPTLGLDPISAREFRNLLKGLRGKTVLFSSHYLKEVEELADKVVLLKRGRKVGEGTPEELKARLGRMVEVRVKSVPRGMERFVVVDHGGVSVLRLPEKEVDKVEGFEELRVVEPTLEDVYAYFVGEEQDTARMERVRRRWIPRD
ncbi:MAG: ABC transporter ATP-binding protein [Candidatus Aramenus sulfurataquae]|jgi:ABC-2 type transport system ATP-binding protein|uniref:ABC transporter ATP-binding protein n=2 Tax=Candidatus Aramenus sulfurataquae TaxID=1326980 RepID=A0AAE3FJ84_9CREN|nr:ABC transporter ATP-binding protein [Candidatus Aramenus sulfurataquae]